MAADPGAHRAVLRGLASRRERPAVDVARRCRQESVAAEARGGTGGRNRVEGGMDRPTRWG